MSIRVICSCRKENVAVYNQQKQVFVCNGWKFRKSTDSDGHLPLGWYCGESGHYLLAVGKENELGIINRRKSKWSTSYRE